jgi:transcriptional regulator with XRE-family HTH domain
MGWRLHRGLTSVELAQRAGVSYGPVSRAENGGPLRRRTVYALAAALDVRVEELLAVESPPPLPDSALMLRTRSRARAPYRAPRTRPEERAGVTFSMQVAAFPVWLLAQTHREDAIGELARAAAADPPAVLGATLRGKCPSVKAPELRRAWNRWRAWRRNYLHPARPR